jgi:Tol biopolymer transport system component
MFVSDATNLVSGASPNPNTLYIWDAASGAVSFAGGQPIEIDKGGYTYPHFSKDSSRIVFDAVSCPASGLPEVCFHDLVSSAFKALGLPTTEPYHLSQDFKFVVRSGCHSVNGTPTGVAVLDIEAGTSICASTSSAGTEGNNISFIRTKREVPGTPVNPVLSADNRYVVFGSRATNLVPGDINSADDIFVKDLTGGAIARVSINAQGQAGSKNSYSPSISTDGRYISFGSYASNLVPGDNQFCGAISCPDVFLTPNPLYH